MSLQIAQKLKKNNVAVDVISMGELEENQEKLAEFVNGCNKEDNSHLINVPAGVLPSDALLTSPLMMSQHGFGGGDLGGAIGGQVCTCFYVKGHCTLRLHPGPKSMLRVVFPFR